MVKSRCWGSKPRGPSILDTELWGFLEAPESKTCWWIGSYNSGSRPWRFRCDVRLHQYIYHTTGRPGPGSRGCPTNGGRVVAGSQKPRQLVRQGVASWLHEGRQNSGTCHGAGHPAMFVELLSLPEIAKPRALEQNNLGFKIIAAPSFLSFSRFPTVFFRIILWSTEGPGESDCRRTWRRSLSPMVWWSAAGAGCCDVEMVGRSLKWLI